MLMTNADALPEAEQSFISCLLAQVPGLSDAIAVAKRLNALLRRKSPESLDAVFSAGLQRDIGALQAALDLPWTTSPAEGQIARLKMLKRIMYGRAGFELLHARVLEAA